MILALSVVFLANSPPAWILGAGAGAGAAVAAVALRAHLAFQAAPLTFLAAAVTATGGLGALAWTAFKVGALSFGGGFVIIPLLQGDAVHVHHWMSDAEFLNAVALGQFTPGPVVATVAAVLAVRRPRGGDLQPGGVARRRRCDAAGRRLVGAIIGAAGGALVG